MKLWLYFVSDRPRELHPVPDSLLLHWEVFPFFCARVAQCQENYLILRSAGLGCGGESLHHRQGKPKAPSSLQELSAQGKDISMCRNREI